MAQAFIALGSNVDPERNLRAAIERLQTGLPRTRLVSTSRVYRTPPWGYADQPDFLNAVAVVETDLPPAELLALLLGIETRLGRERSFPNAPRTLDLDLIAVDQEVSQDPVCALPHPRMHERGFVLVPLCDVAPDWRHPTLDRTARELLSTVDIAEITEYMDTLTS